jgi:tRNA (cmo5U34)-methyltransferase
MTDFDKSNWSKPEFSKGYRDNADVFIIERRRMLSILQSFYIHFVRDGSPKAVLDLGCGDGIATAAIADAGGIISATLVDGSKDMLAKSGERLVELPDAKYIHASFQNILRESLLEGPYDFIVSSLAIHHLTMEEKAALFSKAYSLLNPEGRFVNIDVVLAPTEALEKWYLALWKEWFDEGKRSLGITGNQFDGIIQQYKDAEENKPDTLNDQLNALRAAGFKDVDCFYKYGIFTMFGGRK